MMKVQRPEAEGITFEEAKVKQQSASPEGVSSEKWKLGLENGASVVTSDEED